MATPKCPSCGNHTFELQEFVPKGANYKMFAVQCSSCGVVVGAMEHESNNASLSHLEREINEIKGIVQTIKTRQS